MGTFNPTRERWRMGGYCIIRATAAAASLFLAAGFALAGTAAAADQCAEWDTAVTTTPAPPQNARSMQAHYRIMRSIPSAVDVLLIGDSLAAAMPAKLAQSLYPRQTIWNTGVGEDRTQQVLWRLHFMQDKIHPRHILIILGTNNLASGDKPCAIAAGINSVFGFIRKKWETPSIIYLTIPPRAPASIETKRTATNVLLHEFLKSTVSVVDTEELKDCSVCYQPDGLHLTMAGYERIIENARRFMK